jgi:23S rRNA (guanosine2251-2'-O)-methyltransferase
MRKLSMEELGRVNFEEYKKIEKNNICFVLDDIRSMSNVGSIFRSSDAFLVEKIYLCGITAKPPHREIEKTALGATESVAWEYYENVIEIIEKLKTQGWKIISLEQADQSVLLHNFEFDKDEKYAIVLGNEVFGVKDEVILVSDRVLEIPQFGTKHSLNVSVTAGIILWDYYSKIIGKVLLMPS